MNYLEIAKKQVKILDYIPGNSKTRKIGKRILINPCPNCGHKDHFFVYEYSNTFSSESKCCKGGSIVDYFVQIEKMKIKTAIDNVLNIVGLKEVNKKSASEIALLTKKNNKIIEYETSRQTCFNYLYSNITLLERQLNTKKDKTKIENFVYGFYSRITLICLEYNVKTFKLIQNFDKEFKLCLENHLNTYKRLKINITEKMKLEILYFLTINAIIKENSNDFLIKNK